MKVLVVVVNYRTPDLVVDSLGSLQHEVEQIGDMHVVVTDNDSGDGSVEVIRSAIDANHWDWCTLIPLTFNGGYGAGNNAGIQPYLDASDYASEWETHSLRARARLRLGQLDAAVISGRAAVALALRWPLMTRTWPFGWAKRWNGGMHGGWFGGSKDEVAKAYLTTWGPVGIRTYMHDRTWTSEEAFVRRAPAVLKTGEGELFVNSFEVVAITG